MAAVNPEKRNGKWKLKNSLWVLLGLIPLAYYAPFFYISNRVNKRSYRVLARGYLLIAFIGVFSFFMTIIADESGIAGVIFFIMILIHMFAFVQAVITCPEYLRLLAENEDRETVMQNMRRAAAIQCESCGALLREKTKFCPECGMQINAQRTASVSPDVPAALTSELNPAAASSELLNVNTCTEEELAALPGLNIIDAKKAIQFRETKGDFATVEEFIVYLHIKPHIAAALHEHLTASPSAVSVPAEQNRPKRTLDF